MIATLTSVYLSLAGGLGGYNIGRYLLRKAVEKRRARKAQAARDAKADDLIEDISGIRERLYAGQLDPVRVKFVRDAVKAALAEVPADATPKKSA